MYEKPMVQRFGTFRDLTQQGCDKEFGSDDGYTFQGQTIVCRSS